MAVMICQQENDHPYGMSVGFETVTPELAREYLGMNWEGNRNRRVSSSARYAKMMADGKWSNYLNMIIFDVDGNLIDGQHRLVSQIEANVTVGYVVLRNAPRDAYEVIDSGVRRTLSDRSEMSNYGSTIASALSQYEVGAPIRRCMSSASGGRTPYATDMDVIEYGCRNADLIQEIESLYRAARRNLGRLSLTAFSVAYAVVSTKIGRDAAREIASELAKWDTEMPQAMAAQKSLMREVNGNKRTAMEQMAIIIHAAEQAAAGKIPNMPTKATITDQMLDGWRRKCTWQRAER